MSICTTHEFRKRLENSAVRLTQRIHQFLGTKKITYPSLKISGRNLIKIFELERERERERERESPRNL
jgi:hypothetical protein